MNSKAFMARRLPISKEVARCVNSLRIMFRRASCFSFRHGRHYITAAGYSHIVVSSLKSQVQNEKSVIIKNKMSLSSGIASKKSWPRQKNILTKGNDGRKS